VFGDATFLPNGQLQPRYVVFKVVDGKTAKLEALQ
jgi:branched-chain amino acid transport system substrate-binding protein